MTVRLPALCRSDSASGIRLPLSIFGAETLAAALLSEDKSTRQERLAELLRGEPPLFLWCVLRAGRWNSEPPKSIGEVAAWLAEHGLLALNGNGAELTGSIHVAVETQFIWTRLFDSALAAAADKDEKAAVRALLIGAAQWLAASKELAGSESDYPLPPWLASLPTCDVAKEENTEVRERTDSLWNGRSPTAESFYPLIRKLSRLAALESEFAVTLEREKLAALKELAYGASHEINNPLANISTRAQALLRDETDPERRRKLATINSQAFRAHEMISDMMLFAKPPRLVRESVNVAKLIDLVIGELLPDAREQGTLLTRNSDPESLTLSADSGQLAVALKALASNSLEAIGCGGRVEFAIRPTTPSQNGHGSAIEIVVTDTGPGISPEVRSHLFDPFYSGREAGRGLGFGLAKCWRIITDHGGQIEVDSEPGRGATIVLRLPISADMEKTW